MGGCSWNLKEGDLFRVAFLFYPVADALLRRLTFTEAAEVYAPQGLFLHKKQKNPRLFR